jgi:hypothetical protein
LRTTAHAGVRRQICFIDTCANDKRELGVNVDKLPGMTFPVGDRRQACQYVLYASRLGEAAMNRDARQTGALSDEVLKALAGQPLLPDMTSVGDGVRRAFEAMRKRGELRQVPIEFVVTDWDGREESHSFRRGKRGQYSSIAPLMYDRRPPEAVFWEHPEALLCKTPGIHAQAFLVPGIEGERHEGFVERLLSTKVHECARTWLGHADDAFQDVRPMVRWPEGGVQDAGVLHKLLHVALVQALGVTAAPGHAGTTTGWEVLAQSRYAAYPIVVIPHLIDVKDWGARQRRRQAALMRWYLETYWNRPTADSGTALPRVMLFLLLQCDGPMAMKDGLRRVLGLPCRKDIVTDDMRAALGGVSVPWWSRVARGMGLTRATHAVGTATTRGVVSCVPLSELTPLEPEHLRDWLRDYVQPWEEGDDYAYVTEARMLYDRAARRPDGTPRTDSIEPQLRKRYDEAARAAGEDV